MQPDHSLQEFIDQTLELARNCMSDVDAIQSDVDAHALAFLDVVRKPDIIAAINGAVVAIVESRLQ